jgi:signal peptidase I
MKESKIVVAWVAIGVIEIAIYICNPLRTATFDPFARMWGFKSFHQPTKSMEPAIGANAFILVSAWPYLLGQPKPGDIIAFRYPVNPEIAYIKRIVAAGDATVAIVEGVTIVNGKTLLEPYARTDSSSPYYYTKMSSVPVPRECYFVMNDNRGVGSDSRQWGCVPRANIIGKLVQFKKLPPWQSNDFDRH